MNDSLAAPGSRPARARDYIAGDEFPNNSGKPQSVRDAELQQKIDIAVSRERERCARVAESWRPAKGEYCDGDPCAEIAGKIRSGE